MTVVFVLRKRAHPKNQKYCKKSLTTFFLNAIIMIQLNIKGYDEDGFEMMCTENRWLVRIGD